MILNASGALLGALVGLITVLLWRFGAWLVGRTRQPQD